MALDLNGLFPNKKHSVGVKENISITTMVIGVVGDIHQGTNLHLTHTFLKM